MRCASHFDDGRFKWIESVGELSRVEQSCYLLFPIWISFSALALTEPRTERMFLCLQWKIAKQLKRETAKKFAFLWFAFKSCGACDVPSRNNLVDLLIFATPSEAQMSIKTFISIAQTHCIAAVGRSVGDNDFLVERTSQWWKRQGWLKNQCP